MSPHDDFADLGFVPDEADALGFKPDVAEPQAGPTTGASVARGVAQGATLGFGDEFAGGVQAALQFMATHPNFQRALTGQWGQGDKDLYIQPNTDATGSAPVPTGEVYQAARDVAREKNAAAEAAHPGAYLAGNLAGGVLTAPLLPGGSVKTLGQAAKTGATLGAVQGFGASDADTAEGLAKDTIIGAGVGAGTAGTIHGVTAGAGALPGALRRSAAIRAVKAAGGIQKDLNKMGEGEAERLGRTLLDSGSVPFGASKSTVGRLAEEQRLHQGARLGAELGEASDRANFDLAQVVAQARKQILAPIAKDPALATEAGDLERLLDGYDLLAKSKGLTFEEANALKSNLYKKVNKFADTPIAKEFRKEFSGLLKSELENQADAINPGAGAEIADANRLYGQFKTAAKLAKQGADREAGNHFAGLGMHLAGGTLGAIAGASDPHGDRSVNSALGALAGAASSKLIQKRGAAMFAPVADAVGSELESLTAKPLSSFISHLAETQPSALGRWAGTLTRALQGGPDEFSASHYVLSQTDPDYQEHMRQLATNAEAQQD